MIPYLLAAVGGYLLGDSMKESQTFADGGETEWDNPKDIQIGDTVSLTPSGPTGKVIDIVEQGAPYARLAKVNWDNGTQDLGYMKFIYKVMPDGKLK